MSNGDSERDRTKISTPDALKKIFSTELVKTRYSGAENPTGELVELMRTPAFQAILNAVRRYALDNRISEAAAASDLIKAFRRADDLWTQAIFQEGVALVADRPEKTNQ